MDKKITLLYFTERDFENKLCVDCHCAMPEYVSINNGTLICKNCVNFHKNLGFNISYIRKIDDEWDPYLLTYMERGGNNRFIRICYNYKISELPLYQKYTCRALEYYRLMLRSEVLAEEPPESLELQYAANPSDLSIIYYPEFQDYHIYTGEYPTETNGIKVSDIGKSIYNGSVKTFQIMKNTSQLIYNTSKPVVKYIGGAAIKGLSYAYHYMTDNNNMYNTPKVDNNNNEKEFKNEVLIPKNYEEWSENNKINQKGNNNINHLNNNNFNQFNNINNLNNNNNFNQFRNNVNQINDDFVDLQNYQFNNNFRNNNINKPNPNNNNINKPYPNNNNNNINKPCPNNNNENINKPYPNNNNNKNNNNNNNNNNNKSKYPIYKEEDIKNEQKENNVTPDISITETYQIADYNSFEQAVIKEETFEPTPGKNDN